ncbi:glycosyltransferase [Leuconostoc pseudomesenteroides]|uniref:Glycosyltransferase n=1 Tax=Leuconostoc falkenbergense TaxID=2766470 RepID=A0A9X3IQC4_9LACO|nr:MULTISPECIES: glycosyltransferase family 2 protein [Leuconostoc]RDG19620.1 glycosyltransferase [Leuconostoc pseudomesenteroides]MCT4389351.1 glycosyltransferase [Leuconostoc falkenbergense]MCT4410528.1 glycosyltransferase [Leuconostoc falkenbergense]MCX7579367.1 glycosyltransferase [Leuconostoc falkenbergense]MDM7647249.1 glycosyltransferase family 2 protein [Leuconostoc falkenbergense]
MELHKNNLKNTSLSIVVPAHNEEDSIQPFYDAVTEQIQNIDAIVYFHFIDDGSTDHTLDKIKYISDKDSNVHYVSFSRKFGKEAAMYAGMQQASGDYVAIMDVDLQDPPELLPKMFDMVSGEDWEVIGTRRINRGSRYKLRSFFAKLFYKLINKVSESRLVAGERDYRIMKRNVVSAILLLGESQRFSRGIFSWVGFRTKYLAFDNIERYKGKTSWTFWGLIKYAIDGIVSFSTLPLAFVTGLGLFSFTLSLLGALVIIVRAIVDKSTSVAGWPSMVTIMLFISGIQLLSLGVIGRYISAVFLEVKHRPIYIKKEEK